MVDKFTIFEQKHGSATRRGQKSAPEAVWNAWSPTGDAIELLNVEPDEMLFKAGQRVGLETVQIPARSERIREVRPAKNKAPQALQTVDPVH